MRLLRNLGSAAVLAFAAALPAAAAAGDDPALVAHVLNRAAFGPRPGDIDAVRRIGVDAWIDAQLEPARIPVPASIRERLDALDAWRLPAGTLIEDYREAQRSARAMQAATAESDANAMPMARRANRQRLGLQATEARLVQAVDSPRQLEEVMTEFWFNHFNVFGGKDLDRALVTNYEKQAIRPHVLGRFRDLLGATARHPAMLFYLDNWVSTGVDAEVNRTARDGRSPVGLNENYARELMELHTLGADSNAYTQKDVTELARMFTGWTFDARATGRGGSLAGVESDAVFVFAPRRHDTGVKHWLGRVVPAGGRAEGEAALDVLASHPATARRVAFRLAQHFVADVPPPALVERLAAEFRMTDGDIRQVMRTLLRSPEFRSPEAQRTKFKTPMQFVVSAARASGRPLVDVRPLAVVLAQLGMPLYGCVTPDGYADTEAAWLNPEGIARRVNFATALATGRATLDRDAAPLAADALLDTLGPAIGPRTRAVVATEPVLAAALVLGGPDFMRR